MKMNFETRPRGVVVVTEENACPRPAVMTPEWFEDRIDLMTTEIAVLVAQAVGQRMLAPVSPSVGEPRTTPYTRPLLLVSEAAEMLGLSPKRFTNIIQEEKTRLGRLPDFVCDAGGTIQRRIITDELLKWAKKRKRRPGRPFKNESGCAT